MIIKNLDVKAIVDGHSIPAEVERCYAVSAAHPYHAILWTPPRKPNPFRRGAVRIDYFVHLAEPPKIAAQVFVTYTTNF